MYLTGAFFGYQKFYDDLYGQLGVAIFKKPKPQVQTKDENIRKSTKAVSKSKIEERSNSLEPVKEPTKESTYSSGDSIELDLKCNIEVGAPQNIDLKTSILLQVKEVIKSSSLGQVKLEKNFLEDFKRIFAPLAGNKMLTRDEIVEIIKNEYKSELNVPKKHTVELKSNRELFVDS